MWIIGLQKFMADSLLKATANNFPSIFALETDIQQYYVRWISCTFYGQYSFTFAKAAVGLAEKYVQFCLQSTFFTLF